MKIILSSKSPRRRQLLAGLDIDFEVRVLPDVDESYPQDLDASRVPEYISRKKAAAYKDMITDDELVITADTVVTLGGKVYGKPKDDDDARAMLHELSGHTHEVITGVALTTRHEQRHFSVTTQVTFKAFTDEEIDYYISHYHPLDKAGAYGIQEWIGYIGCTGLRGSYYNVMGLPVQRIYEEMKDMGVLQ